MFNDISLIGLGLLLLSSLAWGVLDSFRKAIGIEISAASTAGGVCLLQVPFLLILTPVDQLVFSSNYFPFGIGSVFLNVVAGYLFIRSLQVSPLSKTIPFLSFTPVFTAVSGYFFLHEVLPAQGIFGIILVVLGALYLGSGDKLLSFEKGSILMICVSLCWSITPVLDKQAVLSSSTLFHTLILAGGIAAAFGIIAGLQEKKIGAFPAAILRKWKLFTIAGILNLVAVYAQFESFQYFPISYVEAVKRAIGIILAFILGAYLFSEKFTFKTGVAGLLMIVGSGLILFSK